MTALANTHAEVEYTKYLRELRRERALSTLANNYHGSSFEAANTNKWVALSLSARFVSFFDAWTEKSYNAWVKSGKPNNF
jgi:hypothetical protein